MCTSRDLKEALEEVLKVATRREALANWSTAVHRETPLMFQDAVKAFILCKGDIAASGIETIVSHLAALYLCEAESLLQCIERVDPQATPTPIAPRTAVGLTSTAAMAVVLSTPRGADAPICFRCVIS